MLALESILFFIKLTLKITCPSKNMTFNVTHWHELNPWSKKAKDAVPKNGS